MGVVLNGKGLEASLIDVPGAAGFAMRVPTLRVRQCKPADKLRQLSLVSRPDEQVPMVWQEAIGQKSSFAPLHGLGENFLERIEVRIVVEHGHARIAAVQNVIDESRLGGSMWPSHGHKG